MQDFKNLKGWEKADALTLQVYLRTKRFPKEELFGLTSQMRRCSCSIGANIAEGCGRTDPEFARFLQIAVGSATELQYHMLLCRDLGLFAPAEYSEFANEAGIVRRMLITLLNKVRRDNYLERFSEVEFAANTF